MHIFALEDLYGLRIDKLSDEVCIHLDKDNDMEFLTTLECLLLGKNRRKNTETVIFLKRNTTIGDTYSKMQIKQNEKAI